MPYPNWGADPTRGDTCEWSLPRFHTTSAQVPVTRVLSCSCYVFQDIKRIANSLFKTLKTPLPSSETVLGKSADINLLLALVEDIICQQNQAGREFYNESKKKDDPIIITLGSVDIQGKTADSDNLAVSKASGDCHIG